MSSSDCDSVIKEEAGGCRFHQERPWMKEWWSQRAQLVNGAVWKEVIHCIHRAKALLSGDGAPGPAPDSELLSDATSFKGMLFWQKPHLPMKIVKKPIVSALVISQVTAKPHWTIHSQGQVETMIIVKGIISIENSLQLSPSEQFFSEKKSVMIFYSPCLLKASFFFPQWWRFIFEVLKLCLH